MQFVNCQVKSCHRHAAILSWPEKAEITDMQDLRMSQISLIMAARWLMLNIISKNRTETSVKLKFSAIVFTILKVDSFRYYTGL